MRDRRIEPKGQFGGEWRAADLSYARKLVQRGLLDGDRLSWRDPTCRECGHRAMVHGFKNNSLVEVQPRWFRDAREGEASCEWPGCTCATWRPELQARHPTEYAGQVRVTATWVEVPLGKGWIAAYRIVNDHGIPVVGELRIFPDEEDRPRLGEWSGDLCGANARVPRGGITSRQVRQVRVREYLRFMSREVTRFRAQMKDWAKHWGWDSDPATTVTPKPKGARRGRKGRSDTFYAEIAASYVLSLARGSKRPIVDVAAGQRLPTGRVRDMIREARKRKLLTPAKAGVRGGLLTSKGLELFPKHQRIAIAALSGAAPAGEVVSRKVGARVGP